MRCLLYRSSGKGIRYYKIELCSTLFGEYIVQRIYGNIKNRGATGSIKRYFKDFRESQEYYQKILEKKYRRGYKSEGAIFDKWEQEGNMYIFEPIKKHQKLSVRKNHELHRLKIKTILATKI